jgi:hypothetical protein
VAQCKPILKARNAYNCADWDKIGDEVLRQINRFLWKEVKTLDYAVERLTGATATAVDRYSPI